MSDAIKAAEVAVSEANAALTKITNTLYADKRAAEAEVVARHADALSAARKVLADAERALRDAKDTLPDHPWTGKRVFKMEHHGPSYRRLPQRRVEGIVETVRSTTAFAVNVGTWRRPAVGTPLVRLLKKDGSPALGFDGLSNRWDGESIWKLVDDGASSASTPGDSGTTP